MRCTQLPGGRIEEPERGAEERRGVGWGEQCLPDHDADCNKDRSGPRDARSTRRLENQSNTREDNPSKQGRKMQDGRERS